MTPPTIYELSHHHEESYVPYLFWHPTRRMAEHEWSATVAPKLLRATQLAVAAAEQACDGAGTWVGTADIIPHVLPMLEAEGFVRVQPVVRCYYDQTIIRKPAEPDWHHDQLPSEALALANAHNLKLQRQEWEDAGRVWDEPT